MPQAEIELRHLEDAKRLIERGETLVAEQRHRLEELRAHGHPTQQAEQTLESLKSAVRALRDTQNIIEGTLRDIRAQLR